MARNTLARKLYGVLAIEFGKLFLPACSHTFCDPSLLLMLLVGYLPSNFGRFVPPFLHFFHEAMHSPCNA
jgi:hypothetical protein